MDRVLEITVPAGRNPADVLREYATFLDALSDSELDPLRFVTGEDNGICGQEHRVRE